MTGRAHRIGTFGQSALEFALLFPIAFGLFFVVFRAYHANHDAGDRAIQKHGQALELFNHGNSGRIVIDGYEIVPDPLPDALPTGRPGSFLKSLAKSFGLSSLQLGINNLFSNIPFLNDSNIVSAYGKGYVESASEQYVASGFRPDAVDWQEAQQAGYVGSLKSDQATAWFQGANPAGSSFREFVGSGAQQGMVSYADSGFQDPTALREGALQGLLGSNTSRNWFQSGDDDLLKGAARGALAGSIGGLATGKFDLSDIATGAAAGAFYTNTVAKMFPWVDEKNPRSGFTFSAANAAVATMLTGGSRTTFGDVAMAAAAGGFFSGQTMRAVKGDAKGLEGGVRVAGAAAGYAATAGAVTGESLQAVGNSVYSSILVSAGGLPSTDVADVAAGLGNATTDAEVKGLLQTAAAVDYFADLYNRRLGRR